MEEDGMENYIMVGDNKRTVTVMLES